MQAHQMEHTDCKLVIADTDGGTDDMLALMLMVHAYNWKVLGITCVAGNVDVEQACSNVMRLLTVCKRKDIPIYRGCDRSILDKEEPVRFHGEDGLAGKAADYSTGNMSVEQEHAVNTLIRLTAMHHSQITLVTLGPLTNVAAAQILNRHFLGHLKELYIMGGNIQGVGNTTVSAEFNFYCDPEAARVVLNSAKCPLSIIPWEPCKENCLPWEWYEEWIQRDTDKAKFVKQISHIMEEWGKEEGHSGMAICDLLAMAAALYPSIIIAHDVKHVDVELSGEMTRGQMVLHQKVDKHGSNKWTKANLILKLDITMLEKLCEHMTS